MAIIISTAPADYKKKFQCKSCGAIVGYNNNDIQKDYTTDYLGDKDWYTYAKCPLSGNKANQQWITNYQD
jgi:hypothetical protein